MSTRLAVRIGATIGLAVSVSILALLWFGVSGVLRVGHTDLMYVFWPSSLLLIGGWHTTAVGVTITVFSIVTNCLLYAGAGLLLRWVLRPIAKVLSMH
ncbi:MAG: hypothetical protein WCF22_21065 [Candidatus Sulfotelmatobacter sp.]